MPGSKSVLIWERLRYCWVFFSAYTVALVQHVVKQNLSSKRSADCHSCIVSARNWLRTAKSLYSSSDETEEFCLDSTEEEIAALENEFSGECERVGFCHNDLQYGNIMIDEETRLLTIIVSSCYLGVC
jgi:thiamine kinase-like enzyme